MIEEATILDFPEQYDAIVTIPIKNIVVTSTTHIPSLEMLAVDQTLIGFPNLDYISSKKTRERINKGLIKELGKNEDINTESLIEIKFRRRHRFCSKWNNKSFNTLKKIDII